MIKMEAGATQKLIENLTPRPILALRIAGVVPTRQEMYDHIYDHRKRNKFYSFIRIAFSLMTTIYLLWNCGKIYDSIQNARHTSSSDFLLFLKFAPPVLMHIRAVTVLLFFYRNRKNIQEGFDAVLDFLQEAPEDVQIAMVERARKLGSLAMVITACFLTIYYAVDFLWITPVIR